MNAPAATLGGAFQVSHCEDPLIDRIYRSRTLPLPDGSEGPLDVYIPREQGDYLYSLVRHLRPQLTVEVGMANGLSTLFIARALRENGEGRHVAIDPFQSSDWRGIGMNLVRLGGFESLVELVEKPSHQALPELEQAGARAGLVFVDGAHLFDYVITDFLCADRLLETGGLIAFDDSDWPAVNQAIRYVLANRAYEVHSPQVVIEPPPGQPSPLARLARATAQSVPAIRSRARSDFLNPPDRLNIVGRCVVLEKLAPDTRDSQSKCHVDF